MYLYLPSVLLYYQLAHVSGNLDGVWYRGCVCSRGEPYGETCVMSYAWFPLRKSSDGVMSEP